jgi:uncharacterized protein
MKKSSLGFGLGLRPKHYDVIIETWPTEIDWFEIITEDYLVPGGRPHYYLKKIAQRYPIVFHGVSLSIGSIDPLNISYLESVKSLANIVNPAWISDHLCFTGVNEKNLHDLLPLPYTEEALAHVASRVRQVQDFLGQQILLENPSSYVAFEHSTISEWEFLAALAKEADCLLLLDVNNVYVSGFNHGFDPLVYLDAIPVDRVQQFHIAGHHNFGDYIIDTHDATVIEPVWQLYQKAVARFPGVSTLLERDDNIPDLSELILELNQARKLAKIVEENNAPNSYTQASTTAIQ